MPQNPNTEPPPSSKPPRYPPIRPPIAIKMYITDADGKIVQFSYQNDDDEEEFMYQSKSKMQVAKE
jgi:hypothetical protein